MQFVWASAKFIQKEKIQNSNGCYFHSDNGYNLYSEMDCKWLRRVGEAEHPLFYCRVVTALFEESIHVQLPS